MHWFRKHLQGDHIFEKLNSRTFPWVFLKREKFDGLHFCWWSCHIFFIFLSFPVFFHKVQISLSFPWDFDNFQIPWVLRVFHVFQVCGHTDLISFLDRFIKHEWIFYSACILQWDCSQNFVRTSLFSMYSTMRLLPQFCQNFIFFVRTSRYVHKDKHTLHLSPVKLDHLKRAKICLF